MHRFNHPRLADAEAVCCPAGTGGGATVPGTLLSCAQDEPRRSVSQLTRFSPNVSCAGAILQRRTLFGEMGLPDHVENSSASASVRFTLVRQSPSVSSRPLTVESAERPQRSWAC